MILPSRDRVVDRSDAGIGGRITAAGRERTGSAAEQSRNRLRDPWRRVIGCSLVEERSGEGTGAAVPELKEISYSAASATETVPKERSAAIAAEGKALEKVQAQLTDFRNARDA